MSTIVEMPNATITAPVLSSQNDKHADLAVQVFEQMAPELKYMSCPSEPELKYMSCPSEQDESPRTTLWENIHFGYTNARAVFYTWCDVKNQNMGMVPTAMLVRDVGSHDVMLLTHPDLAIQFPKTSLDDHVLALTGALALLDDQFSGVNVMVREDSIFMTDHLLDHALTVRDERVIDGNTWLTCVTRTLR